MYVCLNETRIFLKKSINIQQQSNINPLWYWQFFGSREPKFSI